MNDREKLLHLASMTAPSSAITKHRAPLPFAAEIFALIEAGATVKAACMSDARFPRASAFMAYMRRAPERAEQLQLIYRTREMNAPDAANIKRRATGDEIERALELIATTVEPVDKVLAKPLPSRHALWQKAKSDPSFGNRLRAAMAARAQLKEDRFTNAAKLISASATTPLSRLFADSSLSLPKMGTFYARKKRDDAFAQAVTPILALRRKAQATATQARQVKPPAPLNQHVTLLRQNSFYIAAEKAVPRYLDPEDRADVISDMVLAMLVGTISIADAPNLGRKFASRFLQAQRRHEYSSLDMGVGTKGDATVVDLISNDAWVSA